MPVIARDTVASDHLVYAWPFPIGPEEYEVSCADDEQVVMCPSWIVGDRLGPGRHRWRTPDPSRPVSAYFVLVAPVEISFDVATQFVIPSTGQPVRLRATGSLQVRCSDPGLLVAQFVGLPFDHINEGVVRSVTRSVERMLARLLTRRVVMANTPQAVTDPSQLSSIVEELVAYNPAAGAVFGIELMRMGHMTIFADDGSRPWSAQQNVDWSGGVPRQPSNGDHRAPSNPVASRPDIPLLETVRAPGGVPAQLKRGNSQPAVVSGEIKPRATSGEIPKPQGSGEVRPPGPPQASVSGEIGGGKSADAHRVITTPVPPGPRFAQPIEVPHAGDDITQPGMPTRTGGVTPRATTHVESEEDPPPPRGGSSGILGIGMGGIGTASHGSASPAAKPAAVGSGDIPTKMPPGARVLVPGPNGLMQSATVRQLLQGYYELEVGGSGETIWVPMNGVVPDN